MDNLLIQEELLSLLKEATQASHVQLEPCVWQNAYENFCRHAEKLTESECSSKVMRTIDHARIELEQIPKRLYAIPDRDTTAELYCSKALNVLRGELRIITFELSHPTFAGQNEKMFVSPLHLSEGFHPTNLVEIITPFFEMGLCVTAEKRLAKLTEIIRVFEWAFNTQLCRTPQRSHQPQNPPNTSARQNAGDIDPPESTVTPKLSGAVSITALFSSVS